MRKVYLTQMAGYDTAGADLSETLFSSSVFSLSMISSAKVINRWSGRVTVAVDATVTRLTTTYDNLLKAASDRLFACAGKVNSGLKVSVIGSCIAFTDYPTRLGGISCLGAIVTVQRIFS